MKKLINKYLNFLDFLNIVVKWICIVLAALMTLVVLLQVLTRYLPVPSPSWTEELSRYLMIGMAFLGASTGIKKWNNIKVDFIIEKLPKRMSDIFNYFIKIISFLLILYMTYLALTRLPKVGRIRQSATLDIPMIIPQSSIILGCIAMDLQFIGLLTKPFINTEKGKGK